MTWLWIALLIAALLTGWALTLLGMPGNWLMVAVAAIYAYFGPEGGRADLGTPMVLSLLAMATAGEWLEFLAGALGAAKGGGSRRGIVLAVAGSIAFGLVGLFVGLPVPVVGPVLGAVLFAALGALVGAMIGERWRGRDWPTSWRVGRGAFIGRLLGTAAKLGVATAMVVFTIVGLLV